MNLGIGCKVITRHCPQRFNSSRRNAYCLRSPRFAPLSLLHLESLHTLTFVLSSSLHNTTTARASIDIDIQSATSHDYTGEKGRFTGFSRTLAVFHSLGNFGGTSCFGPETASQVISPSHNKGTGAWRIPGHCPFNHHHRHRVWKAWISTGSSTLITFSLPNPNLPVQRIRRLQIRP